MNDIWFLDLKQMASHLYTIKREEALSHFLDTRQKGPCRRLLGYESESGRLTPPHFGCGPVGSKKSISAYCLQFRKIWACVGFVHVAPHQTLWKNIIWQCLPRRVCLNFWADHGLLPVAETHSLVFAGSHVDRVLWCHLCLENLWSRSTIYALIICRLHK